MATFNYLFPNLNVSPERICLKLNDDIFFCFNSENGKGAQAGRIKTALNNVRPYINVKIYAKCQVKCEK